MLRNFESYDWFTMSLILLFIGIIILKQYNIVKYSQFIKIGFSDIYWTNKKKEGRLVNTFEVIIFTLPHFIIAQIIYLYLEKFNYEVLFNFYPLFNVLIIFSILCLFSTTKYYLEKLINRCLANSSYLNFYLFYKQVIWTYAVFLGLPFLVLSVYLPYEKFDILSLSLLIMVLFYAIKLISFIYKNRGILNMYWYYFILYLCTLEIAPYFFLYKVFAIE